MIVAATAVQNPSIRRPSTSASVSTRIARLTKKSATPSVSTITGSARSVSTGFTSQLAIVSTSAASRRRCTSPP
jgi:hypothetical protein